MLRDTLESISISSSPHGIPIFFDDSRGKTLSFSRESAHFSLAGNVLKEGRWLKFGEVYSNISGYRLIRNGTITAISVHTGDNTTATFEIRKNKVNVIADISLSSNVGDSVDNLNIDVAKGNYLSVLISAGSAISNCVVTVEIAWRY